MLKKPSSPAGETYFHTSDIVQRGKELYATEIEFVRAMKRASGTVDAVARNDEVGFDNGVCMDWF